jgi:hypothetical protein
MKKLLIAMTVTLVCTGAFAQGKLAFLNDTTQIVYFSSDSSKLAPLDQAKSPDGYALAGSGAYVGTDPGSGLNGTIVSLANPGTFVAALYGGATAGSLSLQTVAGIGDWGSEGLFVPIDGTASLNTTFATLPNNVMAYFQIVVWNNTAWSTLATAPTSVPNLANLNGWYAGETAVFTAVPSSGAYSPINQTGDPVNSQWAAGNYAVVDGAGNGAIALQYYGGAVPEPGTFALAGLGLATLLVFRRRK